MYGHRTARYNLAIYSNAVEHVLLPIADGRVTGESPSPLPPFYPRLSLRVLLPPADLVPRVTTDYGPVP